jgi:hypothetical protein
VSEGTGASAPPIFVVGFQRSGTTLLQSMLGAHPAIAAPPETHFVFRIAALRDYYGDLRDDGNLRRVLHETVHSRHSFLADLGLDEDRLFERTRSGGAEYATVFDAVMSEIALAWGKRRWSDKSPGQRPAASLALFPRAQLVHIVRDPRDTVASSVETPWTPGSPRQVARAWRRFTVEAVRTGLEAGPRQYLLVRYEDLVREPEAMLRRVCQFLGEEFEPVMLDPAERTRAGTVIPVAAPWQRQALERVSTARLGRHRRALSPWQRASVAAVVHGELAAFGYGPVSARQLAGGRLLNLLRAPEDLPDAVRRRRLRRSLTPDRHYQEVQQFLERNRRATAVDAP